MNQETLDSTSDCSVWTTTFSDLLTLVLTFFVLKFAMLVPATTPTVVIQPEVKESAASPSTLSREIKSTIVRGDFAQSHVSVKDNGNGVVISIDGSSFNEGDAELSFKALEMVRNIAAVAKSKKLFSEVSVFAEPKISASSRAPWELSRARALEVLRQMIDAGVDTQSISTANYGINNAISEAPIRYPLHRNGHVEIFLTPTAFGSGIGGSESNAGQITVDESVATRLN